MKPVKERNWGDRRGSKNYHSTITEEEAKEIYDDGLLTQRQLASLYGIKQPAICRIKNKKAWKHIHKEEI